MRIGIPKGLGIYEYPVLFEKFFECLNIEVVYSDSTNKEILEEGIHYSIDEECLASKIFLGHIANLVKKSKQNEIDYIFVPRLCTFKKKQTVCVKFYALYDICKNLFDANFITLNIDYEKHENEWKAFLHLGKVLQKSTADILRAYLVAKKMQKEYNMKRFQKQKEILTKKDTKILLVAHPYIYQDDYLGGNIKKYLNELNCELLYADINSSIIFPRENSKKRYQDISTALYWKQSIELLNGVVEYGDQVDGIIYLSVFPCGTDSLVTELATRKIKQVPSMNLILDDQEGNAGIYTRLESFVDILESKKRRKDKYEREKISY